MSGDCLGQREQITVAMDRLRQKTPISDSQAGMQSSTQKTMCSKSLLNTLELLNWIWPGTYCTVGVTNYQRQRERLESMREWQQGGRVRETGEHERVATGRESERDWRAWESGNREGEWERLKRLRDWAERGTEVVFSSIACMFRYFRQGLESQRCHQNLSRSSVHWSV